MKKTRKLKPKVAPVEIKRCSGCGGKGASPLEGMVGFEPKTCRYCAGRGWVEAKPA